MFLYHRKKTFKIIKRERGGFGEDGGKAEISIAYKIMDDRKSLIHFNMALKNKCITYLKVEKHSDRGKNGRFQLL